MLQSMSDSCLPPKAQINKCVFCGREAGMIVPSDPQKLWTTMRYMNGPELLTVVSGMCNQCRRPDWLPCKRGHTGPTECYRTCYPTVPMSDPRAIQAIAQSSRNGPTPRTPISAAVRRAVFERDRYTCQACGASGHAAGVQLVIDHKKPLKRGGTNEMSNLQTLCSKCNARKGTKNTGYGDSVDE